MDQVAKPKKPGVEDPWLASPSVTRHSRQRSEAFDVRLDVSKSAAATVSSADEGTEEDMNFSRDQRSSIVLKEKKNCNVYHCPAIK